MNKKQPEHEHHHHEEHEHHHDHSKNVKIVQDSGFYQINSVKTYLNIFTKIIHKIDSPVDFYDNHKEFRDACAGIDICLRWGRKANHSMKYAFVLQMSNNEGDVFTVQSDRDLEKYDQSVFPWHGCDLFEKEDENEGG